MPSSTDVVTNGTDHTRVTATQAKALAVRTSSISKSADDAQRIPGSELAEQLNEETKSKYIKG